MVGWEEIGGDVGELVVIVLTQCIGVLIQFEETQKCLLLLLEQMHENLFLFLTQRRRERA
jgi:hypothetical protein